MNARLDGSMARILITGGSGFVGTNLVEYFSTRGCEVLSLDASAPRNAAHLRYWRRVDLLDATGIMQAVRDFEPEVLLHFGARTDLDGATIADYAANTVGVDNVLNAMASLRTLKRAIFASSRLVCRIGYQPRSEADYCPSTPYGESKVEGEKIIQSNSHRIPCPWAIVRPTSIWGPWFDIPYKTFFLTIANGRYFHPGDETIRKSFGFVGNTVHQLRCLIEADGERINGKTLYLADYPPIEVREMANSIQSALGAKPIRSIDLRWLKAAARGGDLLKRLGWNNPPLTSFRLANLRTEMVYDLESLRSIVGDLPYSMLQGIETTVDWLKAHGEVR